MKLQRSLLSTLVGATLAALASGPVFAADDDATHGPVRATLLVTSTNNATANNVVVFRLDTSGAPALSYVTSLATGGAGGAGGNAGLVQFHDGLGAVANHGSNSVTQLIREGDFVYVGKSIGLAPGCTGPVSVALKHEHLYAVGANCAEAHAWPSGKLDGSAVALPDASSAQIVAGRSWAAVTMKSGSVTQLPLTRQGGLSGTASMVALPAGANDTPLGAAFWGDVLGFNPAHSPNSLALVDRDRMVYPIAGPTPAFPNGNAPCWLVKGPGNLWYSGNTPAHAISIFFSDGMGGAFYKSVPLPGAPTDLTISADGKWLAAIYTAADGGHIAVFSIDAYGDLRPAATTGAIGVPSFNGVAFSQ
ncbi:hypothetical protein [Roseateles saccharophilus]|uniref:6-phosphogluconolactonase (Cycloisomerase 2 family) n=1 Tax=Roseateles saccharophilus TaxID=304 RepID=A0A4R3VCE5_ROSSA|nr:hypothetical protein [Roseateles saccharophilus]MDG0831740.1 hypothetical protein [Roseateles saccharophilus]TCV01239.1 hypothetical protein EV671_1006165 [Roseateles saccharophilus]